MVHGGGANLIVAEQWHCSLLPLKSILITNAALDPDLGGSLSSCDLSLTLNKVSFTLVNRSGRLPSLSLSHCP